MSTTVKHKPKQAQALSNLADSGMYKPKTVAHAVKRTPRPATTKIVATRGDIDPPLIQTVKGHLKFSTV